MKKILLILLLIIPLSIYAYPPRVNMVDTELILEKTVTLADSTSSDTLSTDYFIPFADSVSFIAEIVSADSAEADGAKATINARIRYYSPSLIADTTTYANLPLAVNLVSGNAVFGTVITQISSKKTQRAKLEYFIYNGNDGEQTIKVRIFVIKEWNK